MGEKQKHRTIIFYKDYFENFFLRQRAKVQDKIIRTFDLIEELPGIPETYLKNIEDTDVFMKSGFSQAVIYFEFSVFFDQGHLVVLANGYKVMRTLKLAL